MEKCGDVRRPGVGVASHLAALLLVLLVLSGSFSRSLGASTGAAATTIAVIYPDLAEPYRSIFAQIIEGIEAADRARVASFPIGAATMADLPAELQRRNIHAVIALGRNGLKTAAGLGGDVLVIGGCVVSVPEVEAQGQTIFSLAPDPALLFARLKALQPKVTRVHVVYDPAQSGWLIRRAQAAAKAGGLTLELHEAADLKTALRLYQDILANIDPQSDSLWLPQDATTVEDTTILPLLLEEAWSRNLVLFSSNVAHVRRGALFSLYPNNRELGRHLAASVSGLAESRRQGLVPLTDVQSALNIRTAAHLGLHLSEAQERSFEQLFPEQ